MDALQTLKTTIENMLVVTRNEANRPVGMGGNMWGIGYEQGIRAGYHSQATCLTMLLEQVEMEMEKLAENEPEDMSQIVPRALAQIQAEMDAEKQPGKPISAIEAANAFAGMRSFLGSAKTHQQA